LLTLLSNRATDAPTEEILDRKPVPKHASLFTMNMWKMIIGQSVYKLAVIFMLYFAGDKLLDGLLSTNPEHRAKELDTVVFNTFVWMQIFNEFNSRRLDNKFNIFEGMFRNYWFLGINAIMVGGQIMIIYIGGQAFGVTRLSGALWGICIICSIACWPWAVVLRLIPDRHFGVVFNATVGGMAVVVRPLSRGCKAIGHGIKVLFRPVKRFTRRVVRKRKPADDDVNLNSQAAKAEDPERAPAHVEAFPERPATPTLVVVPPITITTSP
jgi:Ca2+-transporting ATPase